MVDVFTFVQRSILPRILFLSPSFSLSMCVPTGRWTSTVVSALGLPGTSPTGKKKKRDLHCEGNSLHTCPFGTRFRYRPGTRYCWRGESTRVQGITVLFCRPVLCAYSRPQLSEFRIRHEMCPGHRSEIRAKGTGKYCMAIGQFDPHTWSRGLV